MNVRSRLVCLDIIYFSKRADCFSSLLDNCLSKEFEEITNLCMSACDMTMKKRKMMISSLRCSLMLIRSSSLEIQIVMQKRSFLNYDRNRTVDSMQKRNVLSFSLSLSLFVFSLSLLHCHESLKRQE